MRKSLILAAIAVCGSFATSSMAAMIANSVAGFAPGGGSTVSVANPLAMPKSVATWQADVAAAHGANLGGVWNGATLTPVQSDGAGGDQAFIAANHPLELRYGAGLSKTLLFTPPVAAANNAQATRTAVFSSAGATSGTRVVTVGSNTTATIGLSLSGALDPGEGISEVAMALLPRSGSVGAVTWTATFSGGGTQAYTAATSLTTQVAASDPAIFIYFAAPVGQSITQLSYSSTSTRENPFDDFSFRTSVIPEPTVLGLAMVGGLALLRRRR
jgi:hypothetical protein